MDPLEKIGATTWRYGSRASGDFQPFSDLDIMVETTDLDLSREVSQIQEELSNGNFPYKVDIVLFSEFAESYKPGYFKDRKHFLKA